MVTVFGLGFVGLTTALGFAHLGYKVYGIDVDEERKSIIKKWKASVSGTRNGRGVAKASE